MEIKLCFEGWMNGVQVNSVLIPDISENPVPVPEGTTVVELVKNLKSGKWFLSFADCFASCNDYNVEFFDIEEND